MAKELRPLDVTNVPDLLRLAEEIRETGESRVLRRHDEDLAIVGPVSAKAKARVTHRPSKNDLAAFRAAAGSWADVDTDRFLADNAESRRRSTRAPVDL
jgi:hypothetical protein